jgi:hypothetical protein
VKKHCWQGRQEGKLSSRKVVRGLGWGNKRLMPSSLELSNQHGLTEPCKKPDEKENYGLFCGIWAGILQSTEMRNNIVITGMLDLCALFRSYKYPETHSRLFKSKAEPQDSERKT